MTVQARTRPRWMARRAASCSALRVLATTFVARLPITRISQQARSMDEFISGSLGVAESGSFRPLLSDPLPTGRRRFETAILKAVTTSE
jgi:hypothetical protein